MMSQVIRKLLFTVITGNYDALHQPRVVSKDWDYVCFTDKAISGHQGIWKMVDVGNKLSSYPRDPKKRASMITIRYFDFVEDKYDIVASADANLWMNTGIEELYKKYFDPDLHDLALCSHGTRDCAYKEAEECKRLGYDRKVIIDRQMIGYRLAGFPEGHGLFSGHFFIRRNHSHALRDFCKIWADEILAHSKRNQLSLNYAMWRSGDKVRVSVIDWDTIFLDLREFEILMHSQNTRGQWTKLSRYLLSFLNRI